MTKIKILPTITTHQSDWKAKVKEIDELGLTEVSLFPTALNIDERKEYYELISKTGIKSVPHVHIRTDFEEWELDYLTKEYDSKVFNIHSGVDALELFKRCDKYIDSIFIENLCIMDASIYDQADMCGGLCLDFSHWEEGYLSKLDWYDEFQKKVDEYKIGCAHISAVSSKLSSHGRYGWMFNNHTLNKLGEFDYMKKYLKYIPDYISIEITNTLSEQLKAKKYLESIIINGT